MTASEQEQVLSQLHRLLEIVVLNHANQPWLFSVAVRRGKRETVLALLE